MPAALALLAKPIQGPTATNRKRRRAGKGKKKTGQELEAPLPPLAATAAVEGEQCPGVPADAAFPSCDEVQPEPSGELPPQDAWASNETLVKIRGEPPGLNKTLLGRARRSKGEAVGLVQQALLSWGCRILDRNVLPVHGADESFGRETDAAVRKFQCRSSLTIDGIVGPLTLRKLDEFVAGAPPIVIPEIPPAPVAPLNTLRIWINAFIPKDAPKARPIPGRSGETMIAGPTPASDCFATDQRTFDDTFRPIPSSRMHSEMFTDFNSGKFNQDHTTGATEEVDCEDGALECSKSAPTDRMQFGKVAPTEFTLAAAAHNPCFTGSPDIDYTGLFSVDRAARELTFKVFIDRFPAFEAYAQPDGGTVNELFRVGPIGQSPAELFGPATFLVSGKKKL